jgi:hypothetical protein
MTTMMDGGNIECAGAIFDDVYPWLKKRPQKEAFTTDQYLRGG